MKDKEIKADHFKTIGELIETCKMWIRDDDYEAYCRFFEMQCMEALINLTDKQNKELNKLKSKNKELLRKLRNRVKENNKLIKYSNYKKEFSTLNKQIDKQNKVIDEMAKMIEANDIDEDICRQVRNTDCNDYEDNQKCIECIKQYFIRKVEEDE